MITPTNHVIAGADLYCACPWHFKEFFYIFLANIGEDQKKSHHPSSGPLASTALCYGKSGPSNCITFIKRLNESLRYQLLQQKLSISPGLYVHLNWLAKTELRVGERGWLSILW